MSKDRDNLQEKDFFSRDQSEDLGRWSEIESEIYEWRHSQTKVKKINFYKMLETMDDYKPRLPLNDLILTLSESWNIIRDVQKEIKQILKIERGIVTGLLDEKKMSHIFNLLKKIKETKFFSTCSIPYYIKKDEILKKLEFLYDMTKPLQDRINEFFKQTDIDIQSLSLLLTILDEYKYPLISTRIKEVLKLSEEQEMQALYAVYDKYKITIPHKYLINTFIFLRYYIIYEKIKERFFKHLSYFEIYPIIETIAESYTDYLSQKKNIKYLEFTIRDFIAQHPIVLESGLTFFSKEVKIYDSNEYLGQIDLLFIDQDCNFVVTEIKKKQDIYKEVGQINFYMGWVRENLANKLGVKVRGILVQDRPPSKKLKFAIKRHPIKVIQYQLKDFKCTYKFHTEV